MPLLCASITTVKIFFAKCLSAFTVRKEGRIPSCCRADPWKKQCPIAGSHFSLPPVIKAAVVELVVVPLVISLIVIVQ